jgi:hypothetical protein
MFSMDYQTLLLLVVLLAVVLGLLLVAWRLFVPRLDQPDNAADLGRVATAEVGQQDVLVKTSAWTVRRFSVRFGVVASALLGLFFSAGILKSQDRQAQLVQRESSLIDVETAYWAKENALADRTADLDSREKRLEKKEEEAHQQQEALNKKLGVEPVEETWNLKNRLMFDIGDKTSPMALVIKYADHECLQKVERAKMVGSTVERGDIQALLSTTVRDCQYGRADRAECVQFAKEAAMLLDLTDHPEYSDYNYEVTSLVEEVGFETRQVPGKETAIGIASETLTFECLNKRKYWRKPEAKAQRSFVLKIAPGVQRRKPYEFGDRLKVWVNGELRKNGTIWSIECFATSMLRCNNYLLVIDVPLEELKKNEGKATVKVSVGPVEQDSPFSLYGLNVERYRKGIRHVKIQVRSDREMSEHAWFRYLVGEKPHKGYKPLSFLHSAQENALPPSQSQDGMFVYEYEEDDPAHAILFWPSSITSVKRQSNASRQSFGLAFSNLSFR